MRSSNTQKLSLLLLFLGFVFVPVMADANPQETEVNVIVPQESEVELSPSEVRELAVQLEKMVEGEQDPRAWVRWLQNFNIKRRIISSMRNYSANQDNPQALSSLRHMIDFPLGHLMVHFVETIIGWAAPLVAAGLGASPEVVSTVAVIGAIIQIPTGGITDPLCGLYILTYPHPKVNGTVRKIRIGLVTAAGFLPRTIGRAFTQEQDVMSFIIEKLMEGKAGRFSRVFRHQDDTFEFGLRTKEGKEFIRFELVPTDDNGATLTKVEVQSALAAGVSRRYLKKMLRPFGWNVKDAVLEAFDAAVAKNPFRLLKRTAYISGVIAPHKEEEQWILQNRFLVEEAPAPGTQRPTLRFRTEHSVYKNEPTESELLWVRVQFRSLAVVVRARRRFRWRQLTCVDAILPRGHQLDLRPVSTTLASSP